MARKRCNPMLSRKIYSRWMEKEQRAKIANILEIVEPKGIILDIGSGPGFLEEKIPQAIALDVDIESLKKVKGTKILASGDFLPFKSGAIETVFCIDSVHLLENIKEISRVLRDSGIAIITAFCNEHNSKERLNSLRNLFSGSLKIEREAIVKGEKELDAVIVCRKKSNNQKVLNVLF